MHSRRHHLLECTAGLSVLCTRILSVPHYVDPDSVVEGGCHSLALFVHRPLRDIPIHDRRGLLMVVVGVSQAVAS